MGNFFDSFSAAFAHRSSENKKDETPFPVRVNPPYSGRIVVLEVIEKNEMYAKNYMSLLETYASTCKRDGAKYHIEGKKISIEFPTGNMAEKAREIFGEK